MKTSINQIYQNIFQEVFAVYEVFAEFFGEEFTDLQIPNPDTKKEAIYFHLLDNNISLPLFKDSLNTMVEIPSTMMDEMLHLFNSTKSAIYVYWPKVTITNENDRSIDIEDLYAKIEVDIEGRIPYENTGFMLNRTTYSKMQFLNDYMHSHIQNIPKDNFTKFMKPCLGTGPINETIATLKNSNDSTMWMLFCQELSLYVTVESLRGVPWHKLETVGEIKKSSNYSYYSKPSQNFFIKHHQGVIPLNVYSDFTKYYLEHGHLNLSYRDGKFIPGDSCINYCIDISNSFIDFYNTHSYRNLTVSTLFNNGLITKGIIKEDGFYTFSDTSALDLSRYEGKYVLTFKDQPMYLHIYEESASEQNTSIMLNAEVAMSILYTILNIINFRYVNKHHITTFITPVTSIGEKVFYL